MRCKHCDYPLWQIRPRVCPECGAPFKPSEFQFVINSVQFRCPHCEQDYYGTDQNGHLQPPEFDCIGCSRRISMDEMVLLPTEGVHEVLTLTGRNPWIERRENSWFGALFRTIGMAIAAPRPLGKYTPSSSSAFQAFVFATIVNVVYVAFGGLWLFAFPLIFVGGMTAGRGVGVLMGALMMLALVPIGLVVIALVVHGVLRMTGPTEQGLKGTSQAVWYTSAVNLPTAVPCVSFYIAPIGWVWWAIAAGFALQGVHKCKGWRAALAVTAPALLVVGSLVGLVVFAVYRVGAAASAATGAVTTANVSAVSAAAGTNIAMWGGAIRSAAMVSPSTLPRHVIELVDADPSLTYVDSPFMAYSVVIGTENVGMLSSMLPAQKRAAVAAIAASLPANTVAHRLGDYVFTYNGIDLKSAPGGVWSAVYWPNPDQSPLLPGRTFHAVSFDGTVESFTNEVLFDAGLKRQNELRSGAGLPLLPHPKTVTHARPALAQPADEGK